MQIITDSAALLSRQEGITMGVDVIPLSVIVNGHSYLDLEELDGPSLIEIINQGHFPTTSQPSVGETLEVFQKDLLYHHGGWHLRYLSERSRCPEDDGVSRRHPYLKFSHFMRPTALFGGKGHSTSTARKKPLRDHSGPPGEPKQCSFLSYSPGLWIS